MQSRRWELQKTEKEDDTEVTALQPQLLTNKYWEGCNNWWCSHAPQLLTNKYWEGCNNWWCSHAGGSYRKRKKEDDTEVTALQPQLLTKYWEGCSIIGGVASAWKLQKWKTEDAYIARVTALQP